MPQEDEPLANPKTQHLTPNTLLTNPVFGDHLLAPQLKLCYLMLRKLRPNLRKHWGCYRKRIVRNDEVVGSIPTSSTKFSITYKAYPKSLSHCCPH